MYKRQPQAEIYLEYVNDLLHSYKSKYRDLYVIVAGDWNRAETRIIFDDFAEIHECRSANSSTEMYRSLFIVLLCVQIDAVPTDVMLPQIRTLFLKGLWSTQCFNSNLSQHSLSDEMKS